MPGKLVLYRIEWQKTPDTMKPKNKTITCLALISGVIFPAIVIAAPTDGYSVPLVDIRSVAGDDMGKMMGLGKLSKPELRNLNLGIQILRQQTAASRYSKGWRDGWAARTSLPEPPPLVPKGPSLQQSLIGVPSAPPTKERTYSLGCMKGLKAIGVIVEPIRLEEEKVQNFNLTASQLKTDVELKLQQNGMEIEEQQPFNAYLYVNVNTVQSSDGAIIYAMAVDLKQDVSPNRDTSSHTTGSTWNSGSVGTAGVYTSSDAIRKAVSDATDQFINEYLKENAKH